MHHVGSVSHVSNAKYRKIEPFTQARTQLHPNAGSTFCSACIFRTALLLSESGVEGQILQIVRSLRRLKQKLGLPTSGVLRPGSYQMRHALTKSRDTTSVAPWVRNNTCTFGRDKRGKSYATGAHCWSCWGEQRSVWERRNPMHINANFPHSAHCTLCFTPPYKTAELHGDSKPDVFIVSYASRRISHSVKRASYLGRCFAWMKQIFA